MHEEPSNPWRHACFVATVIAVAMLFATAILMVDINVYRQQAIQRGYAEYNQKTGEWQWKGEGR